MRQVGFHYFAKRVFEWCLALLGLVLVSPLLLVLALLVRFRMGTPVLFRQRRPGHHERPIHVLKLRTMNDVLGLNGELLPDAERLTSLGKFLRSTSLDELPQLLNVIRGELCLIGPRPLRMEYLDRYTPRQRTRHEVMPGITGWAQVNGRNALSWQEKFELDIWYVKNWSLLLDIKILVLTVVRVMQREGISSDEHATMPEFRG
jgi:sugar transferase EpsL